MIIDMEKKKYIKPHIKELVTPFLLQSFSAGGTGDAGDAVAKGNQMDMDDDGYEESENICYYMPGIAFSYKNGSEEILLCY